MTKLDIAAEPGMHEICLRRDFAAPRELVFSAFTDPNLIPQWWGPHYLTTTVDQMELRKGGLWRFIQYDSDGNVYGFHGVFHEIVTPERLVFTFEFEGMPGHVMLETIRFAEHNGVTTMIDSSVFQSIEDRDAMLRSGMENGAAESLERLTALLEML